MSSAEVKDPLLGHWGQTRRELVQARRAAARIAQSIRAYARVLREGRRGVSQ